MFSNTLLKNSEQINKDKLKKVIDSTLFDKLRKEEQDKGFTESVLIEIKKERYHFLIYFFLMYFYQHFKYQNGKNLCCISLQKV